MDEKLRKNYISPEALLRGTVENALMYFSNGGSIEARIRGSSTIERLYCK